MLRLQNLDLYSEESLKEKLLKNINLTINQNDKIILTGPSGSGKTTLLKNLAGLQKSYKGNIFFNNDEVKDQKELIQECCYLGQESLSYQGSVKELITFIAEFNNNLNLDFNNLDKFYDYCSKLILDKGIIDKQFSSLSGGEKKRVEFIFCLLGSKPILLLDELLAPLHPDLKLSTIEFLKSLDKTVILISHEKDKLENFNEIELSKFWSTK